MRLTLRTALILAAVLLLSSLTFPVYYNGPYPHPPGPTFDRGINRSYMHAIDDRRPDLILLGDSVLTKGVDEAALQELTGLPVYRLDVPGSSSALWYLILKHNLVPAQHQPRYLVVLFRDTILTAPTFRVNRPYFGLIDKFADSKDALLIERAYVSQLSPAQIALERYIPLYTYRAEVRESIDAGLYRILPGLIGCDAACVEDRTAEALGDVPAERMAAAILQAEQPLYLPRELDFAGRVERSFLPELIELTRQRGMRLILVRAPTRIFPGPEAEPEALKQYLRHLAAYLAAENVLLLDLAWMDEIQDSHFVDPHHMTVEGKALFTRLLAAALQAGIE
jgi:hypothetical protein